MTKTKTKKSSGSSNPAYPDAPPTAPGGMSRADLRVELAEVHGVSMEESRNVKWPVLIDMVVQGRLDREAEAGLEVSTEAHQRAPRMADDNPDDPKVEKTKKGKKGKKGKKSKGKKEKPDLAETTSEEPEPEPGLREQELSEMQLPALKAVAREHKMKGYSTLRRADLIAAILEFEASQPAESAQPAEPVEPAEPAEGALFLGLPGVKDYIFNGHRGTGPSSAHRWMNCTASLGATRAFLETLSPNQQAAFAESSEAARQGTTAHAAAEIEARVLLGELDPAEAHAALDVLAGLDEGENYTPEMADSIAEYVNLVQSFIDAGREVKIERKVEALIPLLTATDGEQDIYGLTGSADCIAYPTAEHNVLTVGDLKYGDGENVDPEENPQVRIYALGALSDMADPATGELPDLDRIEYVIAQPRLGGIKTWQESVDDLLDWRDEVLSKALTETLAGLPSATFSPSDKACQWCPVRGSCPALIEHQVEKSKELFTVISEAEVHNDGVVDVEILDNTRLGELYEQIRGLVSLADDMKAEAQRRLHRGEEVPGFHLVSYTPPRTWKAEAKANIISGDIDLPKKIRKALLKPADLVSPTQALKVLGKKAKKIEPLIEVPEKRPVIGPINDRRTAWEGTPPEAMFTKED